MRALAALFLVVGCVACVAMNWPGQLSYDSVVQLHDGRLGHYNPWHPPVMAWMLGVEDSLLPGTGLFILVNALLIFVSFASLLLLPRRVSWIAVVVAALCAALPQFVLYQGIVWKDVLFCDAAVAGFVCLAHAALYRRRGTARWAAIAGSILFLTLATLVRQNGIVALIFGAMALVFVARNNGFPWRQAVACGCAALLTGLLLVGAGGLALQTRTDSGSGTAGQIKLLQLYDLTGIVKQDPHVRLDELARVRPRLAERIYSDGVRLYTPVWVNTLVDSTELQHELDLTSAADLAAQWGDVLLSHPLDYLQVRARVFGWIFFTPDPVRCQVWYTGVTGPPAFLRDLGVARRVRSQDRALATYTALLAATPLLSHATFAVTALVLLGFLIWRRRSADLAMAGLLAAALAFAASFFVISIACDYRYLLFLDVSAMAALLYCAATTDSLTRVP